MILISLGVLLLLFLGAQAYSSFSNKDIESYSYEVIKTYDDFEVRQYEESLFTATKIMNNEYSKASGNGFRVLAGYIFGDNKEKQKIAMTSPVAMSMEDTMTMMFMVPEAYDLDDLPEPNNHNISFVKVPAKKVAAIRFGGWANKARLEEQKQKLIKVLEAQGLQHNNEFSYLGYNPPYEIFGRRNEVIVELQD